MMIDHTDYVRAKCPYCEAPATIEAYNHCPGGPRLGQETIYSLEEKECDCEWKHGDAKKAVKLKYAA